MKNMLDSQLAEVACPHCARKFSESVGKLKTNPALKCPGCGRDFKVRAEGLKAGLAQSEKAIADFKRAISRIGQ